MKRNVLPGRLYMTLSFIGVLFLLFASCKKDKTDTGLPPEINAVTTLDHRDIVLSSIGYGEWIILKGKNLATTFKVDFNTILAADSLIYADDTTITVKIPAVLPDPVNNPITVTTRYGSVTYNFRILQPPPVIYSFDPLAGPTGEVVTIKGDYFGGVSAVTFDGTAASIISSTKTEIKVSVPAGVTAANIFVTTGVGTVKSDKMYGFRYIIFDDALASTWYSSSYSATSVYTNTSPVRRGTRSIKQNYTVGFGAFRTSKNAPTLSLTGYTAVKVSVYAPAASAGKKVKIVLNALSSNGYTATLVEGWNDFQLPLTNLGNPATLTSITVQEFSNLTQEVYIDDIGLL